MKSIRPLRENQPFEVVFTASDGGLNPADVYIVLTGWEPGTRDVKLPPSTEDEVAPGETCRVSGTTPCCDDARTLRIDISVPQARGGGTLVVSQGPSHQQTIAVTGSDSFASSIVP